MITRVTGPDDPRLEPYRHVADPAWLRREGLFVAEGRLVLPELLSSRWQAHSVLLSEPALEQLTPLVAQHPNLDVLVAPADLISSIGGHDFHRGCLALGKSVPGPIFTTFEKIGPGTYLLLSSVSNPDNIGAIFRSARAFGAAGVLLGPGCGDPLYRKAIRTSMGATLHVPWRLADDLVAEMRALQQDGVTVVALTTDASAAPLRDTVAHAGAPIAFVLGSEGYGLPQDTLRAADVCARIPMEAGVDSLNVSAAAAIALYESAGRRATPGSVPPGHS